MIVIFDGVVITVSRPGAFHTVSNVILWDFFSIQVTDSKETMKREKMNQLITYTVLNSVLKRVILHAAVGFSHFESLFS